MNQIYLYPGLLLFLLSCCSFSYGQQKESEEKVITDLMERFIENKPSDIDYTDLQDQLGYYIRNKIDINKASFEDLSQLFFLEDIEINAILEHRRKFGNYLSILELQGIEALNASTAGYLGYFVRVDPGLKTERNSLKDMLKKGKNEFMLMHGNEFQAREGYDSKRAEQGKSHYLGSPYRYVARYKFTYSDRLSFGYNGEKDFGEQFFKGTQPSGFDFNSFHFYYNTGNRFLKTIALGDYQVNFGQGLTFGSGLSSGKSAFVLSVRKNYQALRPYRSLNENEFLRGAAMHIQFHAVDFHVFFSDKYISTNSNMGDTLTTEEQSLGSIQTSGLHRTLTEMAYKGNVQQLIYGGHVAFHKRNLASGLIWANTRYDQNFIPGTAPYQLYNFRGKDLMNTGWDYQYQFRNIVLFGEMAYSSNAGWAGISGLSLPIDDKLDITVLYRNYARNYQATFSNAFAENGDGRNEEGFYTGMVLRLNRVLQLNSYMDIYRSSWLRYLIDAPSEGTDFMGELQFNPNKNTQVYFRFRDEDKNKNTTGTNEIIQYPYLGQRRIYRLNAQFRINEYVSAKSRIEHVQYIHPLETSGKGTLIFQDLSFAFPSAHVSLSSRLALFHINNYNARIYATESDVLNQYAIPVFQNSGVSFYFVLKCSISRTCDVWIKFSETTYSDVKVIGSGLQQINGNTASEMRILIRWSF